MALAVELQANKTTFGDYMIVAFEGVRAAGNRARGAGSSGGVVSMSVQQGFARTREVVFLLVDSDMLNNTAEQGAGGAVSVQGAGTLVVRGCNFTGNAAALGTGGALAAAEVRNATISNSTFVRNQAGGGAAVAAAEGGSLWITATRFEDNAAQRAAGAHPPAAGAALLVLSAASLAADPALWGWAAGRSSPAGGGSGVALSGCVFSGGEAEVGGAVAVAGPLAVTADSTAFSSNAATASGGAVALARGASLRASDITAAGNVAGKDDLGGGAGGLGACDASAASASPSTDGGFLWVGPGCSAALTRAAIASSSAAGSGGAAAVGAAATLTLSASTISGASAGAAGGAVAVNGLALSVSLRSVSVRNVSADTGGFIGFLSADATATPVALRGLNLSVASARVGSMFASAASNAAFQARECAAVPPLAPRPGAAASFGKTPPCVCAAAVQFSISHTRLRRRTPFPPRPHQEPPCLACTVAGVSQAQGWGDRLATQLARITATGPTDPVRSGKGFAVSAMLQDAFGQQVRSLPGRALAVECVRAFLPGASQPFACVVSGQVQELYRCGYPLGFLLLSRASRISPRCCSRSQACRQAKEPIANIPPVFPSLPTPTATAACPSSRSSSTAHRGRWRRSS